MKISSPRMAECIREFVSRDLESQTLKAFALGEIHDANGPRLDVCVLKSGNPGNPGPQYQL
jgi:hypothetical protein